jgi:hypothetical protein
MEDQDKGQDVRKDDEDVEGHAHKAAPSQHKAANDEGDDVEAHMHKSQAHKGMHKA